MIGTIINTALILLGTALGLLLRRGIPERVRTALMSAMGLATVLIGLEGAIGTNDTLCVILCLAFGGALGAALNLELRLEHFGNWIEKRLGNGKEIPWKTTETPRKNYGNTSSKNQLAES